MRIDTWETLRNPKCRDCDLWKTTRYVCLMGDGPVPCDLMIVGEAPGEREEDLRRPFQGKAGKLLDKCLKKVGINRNDVYITNVVHCRPPDNRTPIREEIKACRKYLEDELQAVKPKYVLLLGNVALQGALGRSGITKYRGRLWEKDGVTYLATFHPAAGLRQPRYIQVIEADIKRFAKLAKGGLKPPAEFRWTLVNDTASLRECVRDIAQSDAVSFDIETSGLDPLAPGGQICCLGIGTPQRNWVIPFAYPGSRFKDPRVARKVYDAIYQATQKVPVVVAHNGKFDNKWLTAKFGQRLPHNFDTMLASYLLDENSPHGLKYLSSVHFDAPEYEIPQPVDPEEVSLEDLGKYCALDVYYTLALYRVFDQELREDARLYRVFQQLIMPSSRLFEQVELHGVYVEVDRMTETEQQFAKTVAELEQELMRLAGKSINWNSPQQVAQVLYGDLGLPIVALTKSGKPSTSSEEALPYLLDAHPIIGTLLRYREHLKLAQFITSWKEHIRPETKRMHPTFKLHGTVTGRLSCTDPNLQQVPRDPTIRTLITAPPGWVLVEADYSQVELRVAAALSRDKTMSRVFQTGGDIHTTTAMAITGLPEEQITKEMRKRAKAVNFGFVYGMGAHKFRQYAKVKYNVELTEEEAQHFRERFFELFSELPAWHDRQRRFVKAHNYVRTPIGRIRHLPEVMSSDRGVRAEAERRSINSPVQSAASDLNLFAAIRISEAFPNDVRIIGTVHDAILMEVRESKLSELLPEIKRIMEDRDAVSDVFGWDIPLPLEVEVKVGPWGGGKVYQPTE